MAEKKPGVLDARQRLVEEAAREAGADVLTIVRGNDWALARDGKTLGFLRWDRRLKVAFARTDALGSTTNADLAACVRFVAGVLPRDDRPRFPMPDAARLHEAAPRTLALLRRLVAMNNCNYDRGVDDYREAMAEANALLTGLGVMGRNPDAFPNAPPEPEPEKAPDPVVVYCPGSCGGGTAELPWTEAVRRMNEDGEKVRLARKRALDAGFDKPVFFPHVGGVCGMCAPPPAPPEPAPPDEEGPPEMAVPPERPGGAPLSVTVTVETSPDPDSPGSLNYHLVVRNSEGGSMSFGREESRQAVLERYLDPEATTFIESWLTPGDADSKLRRFAADLRNIVMAGNPVFDGAGLAQALRDEHSLWVRVRTRRHTDPDVALEVRLWVRPEHADAALALLKRFNPDGVTHSEPDQIRASPELHREGPGPARPHLLTAMW